MLCVEIVSECPAAYALVAGPKPLKIFLKIRY